MFKIIRRLTAVAVLACGAAWPLPADQVVMQNGDKYVGRILSLTTNTLVFQNENLGSVTLPRANVTSIILGAAPATTPLPAAPPVNLPVRQPAAAQTSPVSDLPAAFRGIRSQTNLIEQVQSQVLGSAGPEATDKFNQLLDGLSTGRIDLDGLRAEAQSAADQLRSLKKDLGPDASAEADSYLAILDSFLKESAPVNAATNAVRLAPKTRPEK